MQTGGVQGLRVGVQVASPHSCVLRGVALSVRRVCREASWFPRVHWELQPSPSLSGEKNVLTVYHISCFFESLPPKFSELKSLFYFPKERRN